MLALITSRQALLVLYTGHLEAAVTVKTEFHSHLLCRRLTELALWQKLFMFFIRFDTFLPVIILRRRRRLAPRLAAGIFHDLVVVFVGRG